MKTGANNKMKNRKEWKNQGYSLVELIVVIAILAIISSATVYGIVSVSGWEMKSCTKKLDAALEETKMNAMSKGACELEISVDASGNYDVQMKVGVGARAKTMQKQRIANSKVSIYYVGDDAVTEHLISAANSLKISFDSGSGAFKPIAASPTVYCRKIIIKMGTGHVKTIKMVKDTGKHYVD